MPLACVARSNHLATHLVLALGPGLETPPLPLFSFSDSFRFRVPRPLPQARRVVRLVRAMRRGWIRAKPPVATGPKVNLLPSYLFFFFRTGSAGSHGLASR